MKSRLSSKLSLCGALLLAVVVASGSAQAAGSHSGGHGHAAALGQPGDPAKVDRTIEIIATDNEFDIPKIEVREGETIRFVIRNEGEFLHEFNIGTADTHAQHQEEMLMMMEHGMISPTGVNHQMMKMDHSQVASAETNGGMNGHMKHDDPNSVLLEPGETKEVIWTFGGADSLEFACNVPGHYESGMMGQFAIKK
jgi:uncharacterized cupredoxin-like copper-binding protein